MTSWDYAYALNSNLDLDDVATATRIESEGGAGFLDPGVQIPGRDGLLMDDDAPYGPVSLVLRTVLRYTNAAGAVTHGDGEAGHVFENLSKIKAELAGPGLATLTRTVPHIGNVRALVKLVAPGPFVGEQRHVYYWPLECPSGSWQTASESSSAGNPPTNAVTAGDRVVFDPRLSMTTAGTVTITPAYGTTYTIVAGTGPTYPITINVGANTVVDAGTVDVMGDVTFNHEHWFRLDAAGSATITTPGSATVFWRNRWA